MAAHNNGGGGGFSIKQVVGIACTAAGSALAVGIKIGKIEGFDEGFKEGYKKGVDDTEEKLNKVIEEEKNARISGDQELRDEFDKKLADLKLSLGL